MSKDIEKGKALKYGNVKINPVDDHMEKYDKDKTELEKANEKLKSISVLKDVKTEAQVKEELEKNLPQPVMKDYAGGKIKVIPKTNKEYDAIWEAFLTDEEKEFKKYMGYGAKEIKRVGIKDFIDYMGWNSHFDVHAWKTNILHVVVCVNCKHAFTTVEQDYGLCPNCAKDYDMKRFIETVSAVEKSEPGSSGAVRTLFLYDADFRQKYRHKTLEQRLKECAQEGFQGFDTYSLIKDLVVSNNGYNLNVGTFFTQHTMYLKNSNKLFEVLKPIFLALEEHQDDSVEDQIKLLQEMMLKDEYKAEQAN